MKEMVKNFDGQILLLISRLEIGAGCAYPLVNHQKDNAAYPSAWVSGSGAHVLVRPESNPPMYRDAYHVNVITELVSQPMKPHGNMETNR